jgi:hypothetical protein
MVGKPNDLSFCDCGYAEALVKSSLPKRARPIGGGKMRCMSAWWYEDEKGIDVVTEIRRETDSDDPVYVATGMCRILWTDLLRRYHALEEGSGE